MRKSSTKQFDISPVPSTKEPLYAAFFNSPGWCYHPPLSNMLQAWFWQSEKKGASARTNKHLMAFHVMYSFMKKKKC